MQLAEAPVAEHRDAIDRIINFDDPKVMGKVLRSSVLPFWTRAVDRLLMVPEGPVSYVTSRNVDSRVSMVLHQALIEGAANMYQHAIRWSSLDANKEDTKDRAGLALVWSMAWLNHTDSQGLRDGYAHVWGNNDVIAEMRYSLLAQTISNIPSAKEQINFWKFIWNTSLRVDEAIPNFSPEQDSGSLLEDLLIMNSLVPDDKANSNNFRDWFLMFDSQTHGKMQDVFHQAVDRSFQRIGRLHNKHPFYRKVIKQYAEYYMYSSDGLNGLLRMWDQPNVFSNHDFQTCLKSCIQFHPEEAHKKYTHLMQGDAPEVMKAQFIYQNLKKN